MVRCNFCRKRLNFTKSIKTHVNVFQRQWIHYFCSLRCKEKWIYNVKSNKTKIGVSWVLGKYFHRIFFVRTLKKQRESSRRDSWFSEDLNDLKELILTKNNEKRILKIK
jgi:hypothetical protein